jgi:AcrR family transcriptional regulator
MARITKNAEERKLELINAAERLFLEKGYERTAVSDIVKSIHVAQGTFYYHFSSKAQILEAVLEKNFVSLESTLASIGARSDIDPCEKFNQMINCVFRFNKGKRKLIENGRLESNEILHHRLEEMSHVKLIPHIAEVVKAGVAQNQFDAPYPAETANVLFHAVVHLMHEHGLLSHNARRKRVRVALEHLLMRALGVENHRITLKL